MNNLLTIKVFGDVEHKYGPYIRIGYRDKEAAFNLLDKDLKPIDDVAIAYELIEARDYVGYRAVSGEEILRWTKLCCTVRDLYLEIRKNHE